MRGDETEMFVKPMRIDPSAVRRELNQTYIESHNGDERASAIISADRSMPTTSSDGDCDWR